MASHGSGDLMKRRKICVLGSRAVGKSSLIVQFVDNHFIEPYYPTMEATHFKQIPHKGIEYDVSIVDTAGQDEYSLLSPKHAVGMHGYILVYSVTSRQSYDMVKIVYEKLKNFQDIPHLPAVIVGQKSDLAENDSLREVPQDEAKQMAKETGLAWIETSAKSNANVAAVFDMCLEEIEKAMHPERAAAAAAAAGSDAAVGANGSADGKKPSKGQCIIM